MQASTAIVAQEDSSPVTAHSRSSPWILASTADLPLIVATPLLVWCGLSLAQQIWTPAQITSFALIWAIGHHLPGMRRA